MSGRTFLLARNSPIQTTLIDEATGQAVYEIDTPLKLSSYATKIRKLDPSNQPPSYLDDDDADCDHNEHITDMKSALEGTEEDEPEVQLPETSDEVARIYWKLFSDRIIFRGKITTQKEFLPTAGKLGGSFTFTGPDGIQYRWALGMMGLNYPKLVTADEKKTVIAEFHRKHYFTKKRKARLEVNPGGVHMLDYIVLTFVLVENKRRQREQAAASASS